MSTGARYWSCRNSPRCCYTTTPLRHWNAWTWAIQGEWMCGCRDQCGILKPDEVGGWWKIIFPSASFLCAGWFSGDVSWTLVQGFCIGCTFLCFSEHLSVGVVSGFWMTWITVICSYLSSLCCCRNLIPGCAISCYKLLVFLFVLVFLQLFSFYLIAVSL